MRMERGVTLRPVEEEATATEQTITVYGSGLNRLAM
jgi:hypothetical protein